MRIVFLLLLFAVPFLPGCGEKAPPAVDGAPDAFARASQENAVPDYLRDGDEERVLRRGNGEEPQTLDPHRAVGIPAANILRDLFEGLTAETADGNITPGTAVRWNISRDRRTYTFNLRRDARWSNGDKVTAEDFVFGFRHSVSPETASTHIQMLTPIENAEAVYSGEKPPSALGVVSLDDHTVQIVLNAPTPYFLDLLHHPATYPLHRLSVEKYGEAFSRSGNLVSNGAYRLVDWVHRSHVELEANPYYWDAAETSFDRVIYYAIEDQGTELQRFRAGDLDWTEEVPSNLFHWLQKHRPDELVISPWLGSYYFGYNLTRPPFKDNLELRRALAMAVDRDILTEKVTRFGERPSYALVPPGIGEYQPQAPEWAEWSQEERNAKARELYAQAGYSEENPLRVEIRYNTSENHKKVALAVAAMWKQVLGVQSDLINEEWKVLLQNRRQKWLTQVFRAGWIGDYSDPYSFLELFQSQSIRNDFGYSNESYDRMLEEVSKEHIPASRRRLMEAAENLLLPDQPIIPLYTYVTRRLVRPDLKGWKNNIMDHHYSKYMYLEGDKPERDGDEQ